MEDDTFHHWLAARDRAPALWQRDEAFSQVLLMTPDELSAMAALVRAGIVPYLAREGGDGPPGAKPVALVVRLFPLLDADEHPEDEHPTGSSPGQG